MKVFLLLWDKDHTALQIIILYQMQQAIWIHASLSPSAYDMPTSKADFHAFNSSCVSKSKLQTICTCLISD